MLSGHHKRLKILSFASVGAKISSFVEPFENGSAFPLHVFANQKVSEGSIIEKWPTNF